jgi:hypothetical protein
MLIKKFNNKNKKRNLTSVMRFIGIDMILSRNMMKKNAGIIIILVIIRLKNNVVLKYIFALFQFSFSISIVMYLYAIEFIARVINER